MPEKKQIQWEALALVFLLALGYRTLGFILTGDHPLFLNPVVDAGYHFNWAKRIASGDLFGHGPDDVFKPPLYCYILSIITRISQNDISLIQWWQMFLGAFSSVMISWIATCFFNKQTGIIAGVLSAVYAPFLFFESQLLTPCLSIFFNLAAFCFICRPMGLKQPVRLKKDLLPAAICFGLSACVRPDVLLPAGLVGLAVIYFDKDRKAGQKILRFCFFVLVIGLMILPVTLRNYYLVNEFIPVSSNAGINFYVGNHNGADGRSAIPVGLKWERLIASVPQKTLENPSQASKLWFQRALVDIRSDYQAAAGRFIKKGLAFFSFHEFRNNISFSFMQQESWVFGFPFVQYALVLPLSIAGLCLMAARKKKYTPGMTIIIAWTAGFLIAGILFFINARFRVPAVPLMIMAAAFCVNEIGSAVKQKEYKVFIICGLVIAAAVGLNQATRVPDQPNGWVRDFVNLGNALRSSGKYEKALKSYKTALESENDPDAHYLAARLHHQRKENTQAMVHLDQAMAVMKQSPDLFMLKASILLAQGNTSAAKIALHQLNALSETSNLYPKRNEWARSFLILADLEPEKKRIYQNKAWQISPQTAAEFSFIRGENLAKAAAVFKQEAMEKSWDWYSLANYGMILLKLGKYRESSIFLQRALKKAPEKKGLEKLLKQALYLQNR